MAARSAVRFPADSNIPNRDANWRHDQLLWLLAKYGIDLNVQTCLVCPLQEASLLHIASAPCIYQNLLHHRCTKQESVEDVQTEHHLLARYILHLVVNFLGDYRMGNDAWTVAVELAETFMRQRIIGPHSPAIECPGCGLALPGPEAFTSHVKLYMAPQGRVYGDRHMPFGIRELMPQAGRTDLCINMQDLLSRLSDLSPVRVPRQLVMQTATAGQIQEMVSLPFAPRVCSFCKCWVSHEVFAQWHRQHPAACHQAVRTYSWGHQRRIPIVTTGTGNFAAILGLASNWTLEASNWTLEENAQAQLRWRHLCLVVWRTMFGSP